MSTTEVPQRPRALKPKRDRNIEALFKGARERVDREWGRAFDMLGPDLQRAVLAQAVLSTVNFPYEVDAATLQRIIREGMAWTYEQTAVAD
jgi:hypothetical protein